MKTLFKKSLAISLFSLLVTAPLKAEIVLNIPKAVPTLMGSIVSTIMIGIGGICAAPNFSALFQKSESAPGDKARALKKVALGAGLVVAGYCCYKYTHK